MSGFDTLRLGVEDEDALDDVAQFANVAGPVVLLESGEGRVGEFDVGTLRGIRERAEGCLPYVRAAVGRKTG
jgi:hypothetical protein